MEMTPVYVQHDPIYNQIVNRIPISLHWQARREIRNQADDQVWSQVLNFVHEQVWEQIPY